MSQEPMTAVGKALRAVARRDNADFEYWRKQMHRDEQEKMQLYPLLYEVFRGAAELRFAIEGNAGQIRPFVERARPLLWPAQGFPVGKAEALIRSALGESGLVSGFSTEEVVTIRMQTLTYLVEDLDLSDHDLDTLIAQAEQWVATNRDA
ncbi:hypothetical protein [Micromonospora mirobrigensis]|uniref:Uncharacterized protein n=1 Tax=Micromonospora mirobrigensis TaxID=262898 RepID=A0A1C4ZYX9_9ACTN|nr:hypothetical protein [Micromonospora mirobrigensis]SCF38212.1 hypothetical protein GA0070564_10760 [Micromonospora mirobrigensis]